MPRTKKTKILYALISLSFISHLLPYVAWSDFSFLIGRYLSIFFMITVIVPAIIWVGIGIFYLLKKEKDQRQYGIALILLPLASIGFYSSTSLLIEPIKDLGMTRAKPIISALNEFHYNHHRYPASLSELNPEYYSKKNKAPFPFEEDYRYKLLEDEKAYKLSFKIPRKAIYWEYFIAVVFQENYDIKNTNKGLRSCLDVGLCEKIDENWYVWPNIF